MRNTSGMLQTSISPKVQATTVISMAITLVIGLTFPPAVLGIWLGILASVILGCVLTRVELQGLEAIPKGMGDLLTLARDVELTDTDEQFRQSLLKIQNFRDPIFRRLATIRMEQMKADLQTLAQRKVVFQSTESWRVAYEEVLRSPGLHTYLSVAHVESQHYWQDGPGQSSTRLNLELHDAGQITVERTVIVAGHLWPEDQLLPLEPVLTWIDEQHRYGIWLRLVRETALSSEPELISDFGIYGNRAVGMQQLDAAGRTIRFVLSFDSDDLKRAEQWWNRLAVFSISYRDLLDRSH